MEGVNGAESQVVRVQIGQNAFSDLAGNTNTLEVTSEIISVTTLRPEVVQISLDKSTYSSGEVGTLTVTFNAAVDPGALTKDDFIVEGGNLDDEGQGQGLSADGLTYKAIFTPSADIEDASNIIKLGNAWTASGASPLSGAKTEKYSIDTKLPTASVTLDKDAFYSNEQGTLIIDFSEAIAAPSFDASSDLTVEGGVLSDGALSQDGLQYTATFTPTENFVRTGQTVTLGTNWTDEAGNAPLSVSESNVFSVDTKLLQITDVRLIDVNGAEVEKIGSDETATLR